MFRATWDSTGVRCESKSAEKVLKALEKFSRLRTAAECRKKQEKKLRRFVPVYGRSSDLLFMYSID